MTDKEKLAILKETSDVEEGTLNADLELNSVEQYDSMTKLSLIVMMEDEFGKKLTGSEIKNFKTVRDILNIMQ